MPPRNTAADSDTVTMERPTAPQKMLSRRVLVLIVRDQTAATPRIVWHHEVPILEAIFGEGNVKMVEPDELDDGYSKKASPELLIFNKKQDPILPPSQSQGIGHVFIGTPAHEFERLCSVYGRHPDVNEPYAENVYGRLRDGRFERLLGRPELTDLPEDQLRALVISYGATADQLAESKNLAKLAQELGVELG